MYVGVGSEIDKDLFVEVELYSPLGRQRQAPDFGVLSSQEFVNTVIDPLGISCPAGGTLHQGDIFCSKLATMLYRDVFFAR